MTFPFKQPHRKTLSANQEAVLDAKFPNLPTMIPQSVFGKREKFAFCAKATECLMMRRKQKTKHKHGIWSTFEERQFLH